MCICVYVYVYMCMCITLYESIMGTFVSFTGIDGTLVESDKFVDRIILPSDDIILTGHGMPITNDNNRRGDLTVRFRIRHPERIDEIDKIKLRLLEKSSIDR